MGIPQFCGVSNYNTIGFWSKTILGRESAEELTPSDKENLRGRILQIFEEDENVEVYMEDDDGNIEFVGTNRANGNHNPTRGENGNRKGRKHGETKRESREEGDELNTESSNERKRERRRRRSSENETKRKEGLFPPSVER